MQPHKRFYPDLPFPNYAFRPGQNPHPHRPGGHQLGHELEKGPKSNALDLHFHLFALDLFNYSYYWEAHVYWEYLWNCCQRKGDLAVLFQALIFLSARGLKIEIGQLAPAQGHLLRGLILLSKISEVGPKIGAFDLNGLTELIMACQKLKDGQHWQTQLYLHQNLTPQNFKFDV